MPCRARICKSKKNSFHASSPLAAAQWLAVASYMAFLEGHPCEDAFATPKELCRFTRYVRECCREGRDIAISIKEQHFRGDEEESTSEGTSEESSSSESEPERRRRSRRSKKCNRRRECCPNMCIRRGLESCFRGGDEDAPFSRGPRAWCPMRDRNRAECLMRGERRSCPYRGERRNRRI